MHMILHMLGTACERVYEPKERLLRWWRSQRLAYAKPRYFCPWFFLDLICPETRHPKGTNPDKKNQESYNGQLSVAIHTEHNVLNSDIIHDILHAKAPTVSGQKVMSNSSYMTSNKHTFHYEHFQIKDSNWPPLCCRKQLTQLSHQRCDVCTCYKHLLKLFSVFSCDVFF